MENLLEKEIFSQKIRSDVVFFINRILGLPLHDGQLQWFRESHRKINILRPGNRWGKTLAEACKHIWYGMCKPNIADKVETEEEWMGATFETLNFGPDYETAREVLRTAKDIVEGRIILPPQYWDEWGKTNRSLLKGWAIKEDRVEASLLPNLTLITNANILARSYADMGSAFKSKALAFISGDECADIAELWTFTNVTLLPRLVSMSGILDFVGTVQQEGFDYMRMIEMAEVDMEKGGKNFYVQKGTMFENSFLDREEIKRTEAISDPVMRLQTIEGEYTSSGEKYFGPERVSNIFKGNNHFIDAGLPNRQYITSADFSGSKTKWGDYTVILVVDYTEEPYEIVHFWRIKGKDMSIPMQYEQARAICHLFPGKFIMDGSSLGGKNAAVFLSELHPIAIDILAKTKAEMLSTLKVAMDGYQSQKLKRQLVEHDGIPTDENPEWGLIRCQEDPDIRKELMNYKLDDKKIRNDIVMTLAQAIWWIEMRRPKQERKQMVSIDWASTI